MSSIQQLQQHEDFNLQLVQDLFEQLYGIEVLDKDLKKFIEVATEKDDIGYEGTKIEMKIVDDEEYVGVCVCGRVCICEGVRPEAESDDEEEIDPEADTDDEEEMEVSEIVFDGKVAYLNDDTGMIFDPETQDELGLVSKVATKISNNTYIKLVEKPKKPRTYKTFPQWSHPFGKHTELCQDFLNRLKSTTTAIEIEKMKPEFGKLLKKLNAKTAGIEHEDQIDTFGYSWTIHQWSVYDATAADPQGVNRFM